MAIQEHTGIDISQMGEDELRATCKKLGVEADESMGIGKMIDEIFGEKCEGSYIQPTFIDRLSQGNVAPDEGAPL